MRNNKDEKYQFLSLAVLGSGKTTLLTHYMSELLKLMRKYQ